MLKFIYLINDTRYLQTKQLPVLAFAQDPKPWDCAAIVVLYSTEWKVPKKLRWLYTGFHFKFMY